MWQAGCPFTPTFSIKGRALKFYYVGAGLNQLSCSGAPYLMKVTFMYPIYWASARLKCGLLCL
jgi:hypothetical protein